MKRVSLIFTLVAITLAVACQSIAGQPTEPSAVMDAITAALNAQDVDKAMQFVADDAVYNPRVRSSRARPKSKNSMRD